MFLKAVGLIVEFNPFHYGHKYFIDSVKDILADDFEFVLINSYTTGFSQFSLNNLLRLSFKDYKIVTGEIGLPICENNLVLPCGVYGKITRD